MGFKCFFHCRVKADRYWPDEVEGHVYFGNKKEITSFVLKHTNLFII